MSLDDAPSTLVDLASGVATVPAVSNTRQLIAGMSHDQLLDFPGSDAQFVQIVDDDGDAELDL